MRFVCVFKLGLWASGLALSAIAGTSIAWAQERAVVKRTIIESLQDQPPKSRTTAANSYDYSVTRELLPPVDETGQGTTTTGWVTVVEARNLQTGSTTLPESSDKIWFVALFIVVGSCMLFWRQLQPRLGRVIFGLRLFPEPTSGSTPEPSHDGFAGLMARTRALARTVVQKIADQAFLKTKPTDTDELAADAAMATAAEQVAALLNEIEKVVARLKEGSPLRDVLDQELRLIHYRVSAAASAAHNGHDSTEKSAARLRGLVRELERVRRIADSAAASVIDPRERLAVPQTTNEAYALLGVNPDVSPVVLKKLVGALRVTWHPDHARNESDRVLREARIKQINSAWELINTHVSA